jgi:hypothetical protein
MGAGEGRGGSGDSDDSENSDYPLSPFPYFSD